MFIYCSSSSCILRKHWVQIMKVHRYANKTTLSHIHSTQLFFSEVNESNVLPSTSIRRSQVSYRKQIPFFETSIDMLLPGTSRNKVVCYSAGHKNPQIPYYPLWKSLSGRPSTATTTTYFGRVLPTFFKDHQTCCRDKRYLLCRYTTGKPRAFSQGG